mgnify:CR=1 FL=1
MRKAILAVLAASGLAAPRRRACRSGRHTRYPFCLQGDEYPALSYCTSPVTSSARRPPRTRFSIASPIPIASAESEPPSAAYRPAARPRAAARRPAPAGTERHPAASQAHRDATRASEDHSTRERDLTRDCGWIVRLAAEDWWPKTLASGGGCMRRAWLALWRPALCRAAVAMPAAARDFPTASRAAISARCRRLQLLVARRSVRRTASGRDATCAANPYFNAKAEMQTDRSRQSRKEILMRILAFGNSWQSERPRQQHRRRHRPTIPTIRFACMSMAGCSYYECTYNIPASMQRVGLGPLGAMRRSIRISRMPIRTVRYAATSGVTERCAY